MHIKYKVFFFSKCLHQEGLPCFYTLHFTVQGNKVADIHLDHGDLSSGVRGQQSSTDSFCLAHVPTCQTQMKLIIFHQQPLAEGQANATGRTIQTQDVDYLGWHQNYHFDNRHLLTL
ncbi:hypothetical protein AAY473_038326 [Plecturocebus cupreus]